MFQVHQDATLVPLALESDERCGPEDSELPALNASASRDDEGVLHLSLVNIHPGKDLEITLDIRGMEIKDLSGRILTSGQVQDHNTFEHPDLVKAEPFQGIKTGKSGISLLLPAQSILLLDVS